MGTTRSRRRQERRSFRHAVFTFASGSPTSLAIYGAAGEAGITDIDDPWFLSPQTMDGGALFRGTFTTAAASEDAAVPNERYMWGTLGPLVAGAGDASATWQAESQVFPVVW